MLVSSQNDIFSWDKLAILNDLTIFCNVFGGVETAGNGPSVPWRDRNILGFVTGDPETAREW
jgi:hypothetical protein